MAETAICHYHVQAGSEAEFVELLTQHWPVLRRLELVTDAPARQYRRISDNEGRTLAEQEPDAEATTEFVEIFEWTSAEASAAAHRHPDVSAVWERMDALTAEMRFPHYKELLL